MSILFSRKANLIIGKPGERGVRLSSKTPEGSEGFRIVFNVDKSDTRSLNTANIEIYGISENTRNKIASLDNQVTLEAGYERTRISTLAIGGISDYIVERQPPDLFMSIELGEGLREIRDKRVSISIDDAVSTSELIERVSSVTDLPIRYDGELEGIFGTGFAFSGRVDELLDKVSEKEDVDWSIQDGELLVTKRGVGIPGESEVALIESGSGMIATPQRLGRLDQPGWEADGWSVKTVLDPRIKPGERIKIRSKEIEGAYLVRRVEHRGDTRGDVWETEAQVVQL